MFRMLGKIGVDFNSSGIVGCFNCFQISGEVFGKTFFNNQNVGNNFSSGKGIFRQAIGFNNSGFLHQDICH